MAYFPIFIEIEKKKCLVIGGGKVALRKIETLLRYGAQVQVISREVCGEIRALLTPENIYEGELTAAPAEYFSGAVLVIAATGSREVNHQAAVCCHENGIPVNVADAPEECSFFFPAVVKKGDISIGINTGGKSPSVSSQVRRDIEEAVPDYYGDIAEQLGHLREYVKSHVEREVDRRAILKQAAAATFRQERTLSRSEINTMIRQVLNHGTVSGGPVGH